MSEKKDRKEKQVLQDFAKNVQKGVETKQQQVPQTTKQTARDVFDAPPVLQEFEGGWQPAPIAWEPYDSLPAYGNHMPIIEPPSSNTLLPYMQTLQMPKVGTENVPFIKDRTWDTVQGYNNTPYLKTPESPATTPFVQATQQPKKWFDDPVNVNKYINGLLDEFGNPTQPQKQNLKL